MRTAKSDKRKLVRNWTKRENALGYPVDKHGDIMGPDKWDNDALPTAEEASRKYPKGHWDERMAKAKALGEKIRRERDALHVLPTTGRTH